MRLSHEVYVKNVWVKSLWVKTPGVKSIWLKTDSSPKTDSEDEFAADGFLPEDDFLAEAEFLPPIAPCTFKHAAPGAVSVDSRPCKEMNQLYEPQTTLWKNQLTLNKPGSGCAFEGNVASQ